ncbi:hypothetical protein GH714_011965 [Hevea brasiliensis]|uniref:Glycerol-3-phosphate acyltransferase RAM2/GPAT1-8 HAD-like domain-containing protein n=1 Tax=Hevea brasiliensis TaxID=3981 RepID=A0A6A6M5V4_HEVBR|nr:hypothetical protein GH714_011965 [Hevea brasiliensis]
MANPKETSPPPAFPPIDKCTSMGRQNDTVVTDMEGTLLCGRSSFPYFALVAFEAGGILRLVFLLLASPMAAILYYFISESAGIQVLIFATFVGMRVSDIESVARAVLPKFYSSDLHPETWRVISSCGKRCVLTENPRIMVEVFLKDFVGVDMVIGTEIGVYNGRATGWAKSPGILVGQSKADALKRAFGDDKTVPDIGLGDRKTDYPFMKLCKESYMVPPKSRVEPVNGDKLPKPIVFHDGRLVQKPTPFISFLVILWIPVELTDELVPVAMANRMSMFHGTTARGWKGMDPFYFFMNPSPAYEVTFLNKLPYDLTCRAGKSSLDVANYIQRMIAASLSYECTSFTRKDKYRALAGNDGTVEEKPKLARKKGFHLQGVLSNEECDHLINLARDKLEKSMVADNDSGKSIERSENKLWHVSWQSSLAWLAVDTDLKGLSVL